MWKSTVGAPLWEQSIKSKNLEKALKTVENLYFWYLFLLCPLNIAADFKDLGFRWVLFSEFILMWKFAPGGSLIQLDNNLLDIFVAASVKLNTLIISSKAQVPFFGSWSTALIVWAMPVIGACPGRFWKWSFHCLMSLVSLFAKINFDWWLAWA